MGRILRSGARLLTLLGPAGIGKTRLALEHARVDADHYTGVSIARLADHADFDSACGSILAELTGSEAPAATTADVVELVGARLTNLDGVIVVLDRVDHLVEAAASAVARWLELAPKARVIVTSTRRLGLAAEAIFDVGGLEEAPALFVERARLVRPSFEPTARETEAIAEIARRLDGIPLAIELAAARTRVMSVEQLLARLSVEPGMLDAPGTARDQTTIREALSASYELSSPAERRALAQCSVFEGGFDLAAAERVIDPTPDAPPLLAVLEALCDASLLRVEHVLLAGTREARFSLYATVRAFARARLAERPDLDEQVHARHASYFAGAAEAWAEGLQEREGRLEVEARVRKERDNLLAAHRWAVSTRPATVERVELAVRVLAVAEQSVAPFVPPRAYLELLDQVLERAGEAGAPEATRARALLVRSRVLGLLGRIDDALADAEHALQLAESAGHGRLVARAQHHIGDSLWWRGRLSDARRHYERALPGLHHRGDRWLASTALANLSGLDLREGRVAAARMKAERALAMAVELGDRDTQVLHLFSVTLAARSERRLDRARALVAQAADLARELDAPRRKAMCHFLLAEIERESGSTGEARRALAAGQAEIAEAPLMIAAFRMALAKCDDDDGDYGRAIAGFEEVLRTFDDHANARNALLIRAHIAASLACAGDPAGAREALAAAEALPVDGADVVVAIAIDLARAHVELSEAGSDPATAAACRASVRGRVTTVLASAETCDDGATPALPAETWGDVAHLARTLMRRLDAAPPRNAGVLTTSTAERWFSLGDEPRVSLQARPALWQIFEALVDGHRTNPGQPVPVADLARAGWPGESAGSSAVINRLQVAMSTLRKLGLKRVLLRSGEGYLLEGSVALRDAT